MKDEERTVMNEKYLKRFGAYGSGGEKSNEYDENAKALKTRRLKRSYGE